MSTQRSSSWRPTLFRAKQQTTSPTFVDERAPVGASTERRERGVLVDSAIYVDGMRVESPGSLARTYKALAAHTGVPPTVDADGVEHTVPDGMAWIGLYRPDTSRLQSLAKRFDIHELALEDAIQAHQRPKLERYWDEDHERSTLFLVLHAARYVDRTETVEFGELHLFMGDNFVVTLRHAENPNLSGVRRRMEARPELLRLGPEAALYAVLDAVVDGYAPVVAGVEKDIDEIELQVFSGDPSVSRRIYELSQEVVEFRRAARPMVGIINALMLGFQRHDVHEDLQDYLRDVLDHVQNVVEEIDGFRQALQDMLTVNATLVAQQQNDEMRRLQETSFSQGEEVKKISAWAAIFFVPSLITSWYGQNFSHMPELGWAWGPLFSLGLMVGLAGAMWWMFRRRDWL